MAKRKNYTDAARNHFDKLVQCLPLQDESLILIKTGTQLSKSPRVLEQVANAIGRAGYLRCVLLAVNEFDDLSVINAKRARELGWQPVPVNIFRRIFGKKAKK